MATTTEKQRVKTGLREVRSLVLGVHILLGFQYQATFAGLPAEVRLLQVAALILLVASVAFIIASAPYHRIAAAGNATVAMERYTRRMALVALVPFALALAADVGIALSRQFRLPTAGALGVAVAVAALLCWFGPAFATRSAFADHGKNDAKEDDMVSTKDRITDLLTESRIVLPGVQALLGFQFASYLTDAFQRLSPAAKVVNTVSLFMLVIAMVLLMMLAPYHQMVEDGENTEHFERVAERLVLASLAPLALSVAGDVFVVTQVVLGAAAEAAMALACAAGMAALWFGVPWLAARRKPA